MAKVSGGTIVGAYFLKWDKESSDGFIREHEGRFLVCLPTLFFDMKNDNRLFEVVADCKDQRVAKLVLESTRAKPCAGPFAGEGWE